MSIKVMELCWSVQNVTPLAKSILIALAWHANDSGQCFPQVSTICARVCGSERAVRGQIQWLCAHGLLSKTERRGRSSYYTIPMAFPPEYVSEPLQHLHPTPAGSAPPPLQHLHLTPAASAPIKVNERSIEKSLPSPPSVDDDDKGREVVQGKGDGPVKFRMHADWWPDQSDIEMRLASAGGDPDWFKGVWVVEFVSYWLGRPDVLRTAAAWAHTLCKHLQVQVERADAKEIDQAFSVPVGRRVVGQ